MTKAEINGIINGHAIRNEQLLDTLVSKGVSLSEKRSIDHHFWANTREDAAFLGKTLYDRGFIVSTIAPVATTDGSTIWNVEAETQQSLLEAAGLTAVEQLTRLAAQVNAVYDGWGTSV